jgi:catechol 2,3-dioxygenase
MNTTSSLEPYRIHAQAHIGCVSLSVSNLEQSLYYYQDVIGLTLFDQTDARLILGAGNQELLELVEFPGKQHLDGRTGLYHFALLVPTRLELARTLRHLLDADAKFVGFADHHVSEAIYLVDPDGHGIEIYSDRPRSKWVDAAGNFMMTTQSLDIQGLINLLDEDNPHDWRGLHVDTTMGHIHLHVSDLSEAVTFYQEILGFELMFGMQSAAFISAGGYHHHLGLNTWAGVGAPPPPGDSLRLLTYEILLPDINAISQAENRLKLAGYPFQVESKTLYLEDPSANKIVFKAVAL